jgi:hypothetical protein
MRVLVCGSRDWDDESVIFNILSMLFMNHAHPGLVVIEGGARGADRAAAKWADQPGFLPPVKHEQYPADWEKHGRAAGYIRNQQMLDEGKPDVVWAFHDDLSQSRGTADMVRRAKKAGIPVYVVGRA